MYFLSLIYLALTIIRPQDYMPGLVDVPVLSVVLVLAFLFWLGSPAKTMAAPQFLILPAFLLAAMISQVTNGWTGGAIEELKQFGPTVIAFFILASGCTSQRRVMLAMAVFVLCSMVLALHGVEQKSTGIGWTGMTIGEDGRIRYVGIFNDPNDLGLLFVATLPMAFYLAHRSGLLLKLFWLAAALLLLYATYLTNSRGAMLAVLVIAGVYIWRSRGMLTALVLSGAGLTVMKLLSSRMQELDADEPSAMGRVDAWYTGLHLFLSHPLFGVGAGNFTEYNYLTAHNSFVLVLAEIGFIGYTLWLAFVGYSFWMMLAVVRHRSPQGDGSVSAGDWADERAMAFSLLLSLCGLFTAAFFLSRTYTIVLYLVIAVVVGYYVGARQRHPELPPFHLSASWGRWVPVSLVSIFGLFVLVTVLLHTA